MQVNTKTDNDKIAVITTRPLNGAIITVYVKDAKGRKDRCYRMSLTPDDCARLASDLITGAGEDWRKYLS